MPANDPSDAELVDRCRAGDETAWVELVDRFSRYVYAISVQGFRLAAADAEDAFQDVFARAFEQLASLRDGSALRPWLAQLTRRTCIDRLRRSRPETAVDDVETAAEDTLAVLDEAIAVRQALVGLGKPCSEMLDRFFARDESYRTIGEELGLPAGTIASRISRCLEKLRSALEDSSVSPRLEERVM